MSDSSVNSGNNNLFVAILVLYNPRIIRFARQGMCYYESERCERSASPNCVNCLFMWSANQICEALYAQGTEDCHGGRRREDVLESGVPECRFCLFVCCCCFVCFVFLCLKKNVVSLLSDQLAQSTGTVDAPYLFVILKVSSGTRRVGRFYWTWDCRDCYILHGLWSQRVAWEVRYQVPSSSLWGIVSWKGAAALLCPRVCLSSSSYVSVFARLRVRLPTSSISVFVCLRGSATVVCTLTVCAVFHALRTNEGLCCVVMSFDNQPLRMSIVCFHTLSLSICVDVLTVQW